MFSPGISQALQDQLRKILNDNKSSLIGLSVPTEFLPYTSGLLPFDLRPSPKTNEMMWREWRMHESFQFWARWTGQQYFRRKLIRVLRQKIRKEQPTQGEGFVMY